MAGKLPAGCAQTQTQRIYLSWLQPFSSAAKISILALWPAAAMSSASRLPCSNLRTSWICSCSRQVFKLGPRSQAAAVKKDVVAAVIRYDEAVALLPDDLLNGSGHS